MFKSFVAWVKKPDKTFSEQIVEIIVVVLPLAFLIRTVVFGLFKVPTGSMEPTMLVGESFLADKFSPWFRGPKRGDIIAFNDPNFDYSSNPVKNVWQRYVWGPDNWTKRVIGEPSDHVQGKIEDGIPVVYINGTKLDGPYINPFPLLAIWRNGSMSTHPSRVMVTFVPGIASMQQPFYRVDPECIARSPINGQPFVSEPYIPFDDGSDVFDVQLGPDECWAMGDNRRGSHDSRAWGVLKTNLIHSRIILRLFSVDSYDSWWITDFIKHPIDFIKRLRWSRFFQRVRCVDQGKYAVAAQTVES